MGDLEDGLDGFLQAILDFFHTLDQWVPISSEVLSWFVDIPEGREKDLYALADAYQRAATLYAEHLDQITPYMDGLSNWTGDGSAQIAHESLQHHIEHVGNMIDAFNGASEVVHGAAQGIETTKWADAMNLLFLAVSAVIAIVSALFTFGASLAEVGGAMAVCRTAIALAARQLIEKLMEGITRKVIIAALIRGAQFVAFTLLSDIVAWTMEAFEGHNPQIDGWQVAEQMVDSFAVGFLGGLLTKGAHGPFAEAVSMGGGQLAWNALQDTWDGALNDFGLHDWAVDNHLYAGDPNSGGPGLFDGVLQSAMTGAAFGFIGDRAGLTEAIAKLRLDLGLGDLGLADAPHTAEVPADLPSTLDSPNATNLDTGFGSGEGTSGGADPSTLVTQDPSAPQDTGTAGSGGQHDTGGTQTPVTGSGDTAGLTQTPGTDRPTTTAPDQPGTTTGGDRPTTTTTDRPGTTTGGDRPTTSETTPGQSTGTDRPTTTTTDRPGTTTGGDRTTSGTDQPGTLQDADHPASAAGDTGTVTGFEDQTTSGTSGDHPVSTDPLNTDESTRAGATETAGAGQETQQVKSPDIEPAHDTSTSGASTDRPTEPTHTEQSSTEQGKTEPGRQAETGTEPAEGGEQSPNAGENGTGTDTQKPGEAQSGQVQGDQARGSRTDGTATGDGIGARDHRPSFLERLRAKGEAEIQAAYLREILKDLGPRDFSRPEPARLTPEMLDRALRTEPRTSLGQRLRGFLEDHFTTVVDVNGEPVRIPLDEAGIRDTFTRLHDLVYPDQKVEPAAAGHEGSTHEQRWVAAQVERAGEPAAAAPVERGRVLFTEVLERHFGSTEVPADQVDTVRAMVQQALETPRDALSGFREAQDIRSYLRSEFAHTVGREQGRDIVEPLANEQIAAKLHDLHAQSRAMVDDPLGQQTGAETAHAATPTHDAPLEQVPGDVTAPRGPPPPEAIHPRADGPVQAHESMFDRRFFVPDDNGTGGTLHTQDGVHRYFFSQRFEKVSVEELGGMDSPAARRVLHEAALSLVDAVHERAVGALDHWLSGVDDQGNRVTPGQTELRKIGTMVAAVMLPDGTIEASTSVAHELTTTPTSAHLDTAPPDVPVVSGRVEGSAIDLHHWAIQERLDAVPLQDRSGHHALCAEPIALSEIARGLEPDFQRSFLARLHGIDPAHVDGLPPEQRSIDALDDATRARYRDEFRQYLRDQLDGGRSTAHLAGGKDVGKPRFPCATDDRLLDSFGMRADYVDGMAGDALVDPEHGLVVLAPEGDPLRAHAQMLASNHPDWLVVALHGEHSGTGFTARFGGQDIGPVEASRLVTSIVHDNPAFGTRDKVVLITCDANATFQVGDVTSSFAREFALRHGSDVLAAGETVWVSDTGEVVASNTSPAEPLTDFAPDSLDPGAGSTASPWVHLDGAGHLSDPVRLEDVLGRQALGPGHDWRPAEPANRGGAGHDAVPEPVPQGPHPPDEPPTPAPPEPGRADSPLATLPTGELKILGFDNRPGHPEDTVLLERLSRGLGANGDSVALRRPDTTAADLGPGARILGADRLPGITGRISPLLRLDGLPADADVLVGHGSTAGVADRLHNYAYPQAKLVQIVDRIPVDAAGRPDPKWVELLGRADLVVTTPDVTSRVQGLVGGLPDPPVLHELPPVFEAGPPPVRAPGEGGFHILVDGANRASYFDAADIVGELRQRGITDVRLTVTVRDMPPDDIAHLRQRLSETAGAAVEVKLLTPDAPTLSDHVRDADLVFVGPGADRMPAEFVAAVEHGVPVLVDQASAASTLLPEGDRVVAGGMDIGRWADRVQYALVDMAGDRADALQLREQLTSAYPLDPAAWRLHDAIHALDPGVARIDDATWRSKLPVREVVMKHSVDVAPAADGQRVVLTTCTEYWSNKGGIPSANRDLSESFGLVAGADTHALVSTVDFAKPERLVGQGENGVRVIGTEQIWGVLDHKGGPDARALFMLPEGLPDRVDLVVGHSRFSGGGARWLVDHVYPDAKYMHVLHTSPEVLDALKGDTEGAQHAQTERDLMARADLVAGVGPLLAEEAARLTADASRVHPIIPDLPPWGSDPPPRPADRTGYDLLIQGRADDVIKGVKFGARLAAELHAQGLEIRLTVRGAAEKTGPAQEAELRASVGDPPGLTIKVLEFSKNRDELLGDVQHADLVLMPSLHEGFGLVATDAARAGKPILVGEGAGAGWFFGDSRFVPPGLGEPMVIRDGNTLESLRTALAAIAGPDGAVDRANVEALRQQIDDARLQPWLQRAHQMLTHPDPSAALQLRRYLAARYGPGNAGREVLQRLGLLTSPGSVLAALRGEQPQRTVTAGMPETEGTSQPSAG